MRIRPSLRAGVVHGRAGRLRSRLLERLQAAGERAAMLRGRRRSRFDEPAKDNEHRRR